MADTFQKISRIFDKETINPIKKNAIGRVLLAKNPNISGPGVWNIDVTTLNELTPAYIDFALPEGDSSRDDIVPSVDNVKAPVLWKGYKIPRDSFDSFKNKGIPIDTSASTSAAAVVTHQENALLVDGYALDGSNYDIEGLYQAAGNTDSTANDFATAGNALAEVAIMKGKLAEDDIYNVNYNLSLHPTQFAQLDGSILANGDDEFSAVMRKLNPVRGAAPGQILQSTDVTAGTGMLTAVDPGRDYFEYYELQPMRNVLGEDSKIPGISPIFGTTFEVMLPHIKIPEAICTATGI